MAINGKWVIVVGKGINVETVVIDTLDFKGK